MTFPPFLRELVDAARLWYLDERPGLRHRLRDAFETFWNSLPADLQWEIDKRCGTLDAEGPAPAVGCDQWAPLAEMAALAESGLRRAAIEEFHELATPAVVLDLIQHARRAEHPGRAQLEILRSTVESMARRLDEAADRAQARDEELLRVRADSQIDGRAMRTLLGLPDEATAQDIVDALMGVVSEASLWRAWRRAEAKP